VLQIITRFGRFGCNYDDAGLLLILPQQSSFFSILILHTFHVDLRRIQAVDELGQLSIRHTATIEYNRRSVAARIRRTSKVNCCLPLIYLGRVGT